MIPPVMQTVGEFITDCGKRLAPFERRRVGRAGCIVTLAILAAGLICWALGMIPHSPGSWLSGFRLVILSALAALLVLFVGYAAAETMAERSVRQRVESYIRESGTDLETLFRATEIRRTHIPGGERLMALLRERRS